MPGRSSKLSTERFLNIIRELTIKGIVKDDADFAKKIGVIPQSIYDIKSGKNKVGLKYITLIENVFEQVNTLYLKEEQDFPILFEEKKPIKDPVTIYETSNVEIDESKKRRIRVPVIPLDVTASFIVSIDEGLTIKDLDFEFDEIERESGLIYDRLTVIFKITGDSMYPIYRQGMKILCTWVDQSNWKLIQGTHVISTKNGMLLLKKVTKKNNGTLELSSYNPEYGNMFVDLTELNAIWKVAHITYGPGE